MWRRAAVAAFGGRSRSPLQFLTLPDKGCGRAADAIAIAWEKGQSDDPLVAEIIQHGKISLFNVTEDPENLIALLQQKLWEERDEQSRHV